MEFKLFAPHLEKVELVGSWSDEPVAMHKDQSGTWRAEVDLPEGRHCYKFRLKSLSPFMEGRVVEVTDPQARMVDPQSGEASVIILRDGQDLTTAPDYPWQHDHVPLPQDDELVIYELHVGEFAWEGDKPSTFEGLVRRLDYLRDLGVNAVELMPVKAFRGERSWGYLPRHFFALEPGYGNPQDFKRLVDECHARGMRVILDMVFNHSDTEAPLNHIDFYYWYRDPREGELSFGPKFDYERFDDTLGVRPAFRFGLEVAAFWVQEYHVDGYRLDATAILDSFEFVQAVRDLCKDKAGGKPFYVVAEQLPENPAIATPSGPADGAWHQAFELQAVATLCECEVRGKSFDPAAMLEALQPRNHGYVSPARVVNYLESHDEHTLMRVLAEAGITGDKAFRKNKLGATLLFTAVGNPMLYQGQEFGGHRERDMEVRPLQWGLLEHDYGLHLKEHYAFLARLRREIPALKSEDLEPLYLSAEAGVVAYRRGYGQGEVIVVANLHDTDQTLTLPFPDGAWRELTFGYDLEVSGAQLSEDFPASSAKIYIRRS
ncbi:MAG TPA: alpha-amylase family glycosyl hydrolase [Meiothermus sp.]|nr:alpha-amylase family glycosyl hydrolase [Meiothermus sp.]